MATKLTDPYIRNYPNPENRIELYDSVVEGLAVRITHTGHKSFVYRYRFGKAVKRYTIGSKDKYGIAQARSKARELYQQVSDGIDPLSERKRQKAEDERRTTFADLCDTFERQHLPTLRAKTRHEYQRIINQELRPTFGKSRPDTITRKEIIALLDNIAYERKIPVYSNRVRATLSKILSFGMEKALIDHNPVLQVKRKQKTENGASVEHERDRYYNEDEIKSIWEALQLQSEPVASAVRMLLLLGQRSGETKRMRWADIEHVVSHDNTGRVTFKGYVWTIPETETKNKKPHKVPLPDKAVDIIENLRPITGKTDYVFASPRMENTPIQWLQKSAERIKKDSGVPDFRLHDLRRTAATWMGETGTSEEVLGHVLSHSSSGSRITKIYLRKNYNPEKQRALQRWCDKLTEIIEGKKEAKISNIV